ncbi:MAG: hypothetical protein ACE5D0_10180, partial [Fidelibacterota bacterium]
MYASELCPSGSVTITVLFFVIKYSLFLLWAMADFPPTLDLSRFGGQGTANHSFIVGDGRLPSYARSFSLW